MISYEDGLASIDVLVDVLVMDVNNPSPIASSPSIHMSLSTSTTVEEKILRFYFTVSLVDYTVNEF